MSHIFERLGQRLQNMTRLSQQLATNAQTRQQVSESWPQELDALAVDLVETARLLQARAKEIRAFNAHTQEDTEALATLTQTIANMGSIIGPSGKNVHLLTGSDHKYLAELLQAADEKALIKALRALPEEVWRQIIEVRQGSSDSHSLG